MKNLRRGRTARGRVRGGPRGGRLRVQGRPRTVPVDLSRPSSPVPEDRELGLDGAEHGDQGPVPAEAAQDEENRPLRATDAPIGGTEAREGVGINQSMSAVF